MKIRCNAELLSDSMRSVAEIAPTISAIQEYLAMHGRNGEVSVETYSDAPDNRIGWDRTCLVLCNSLPVAFCDEIPLH